MTSPPLARRRAALTAKRWRCALPLLTAGIVASWSGRVAAQGIPLDFPSTASGYEQQLGVTVQSRQRPLYTSTGVQVGGFEIRPNLDQSVSYNSNPTGAPSGPGSWVSRTSAAVSAASTWSRDSLAASVGVDHYDYFSLPSADYTDWNVGLRGGYTIHDSLLTAAYSHSSYHELGGTIGTTAGGANGANGTNGIAATQLGGTIGLARSDTPVADTIDTARVFYTLKLNRVDVTPEISASAYRYGPTTAGGVRQSQQYLDRNVVAGGITTRYAMNDVGGLLVVARTIDSHYLSGLAGQPSNDSQSVQLLAGIDYQAKGTWRYRLLAGGEVRSFTAAQYATRLAPILEGDVTWTPTGLTTVTGIVSRAINDPQFAGTNGYVLTQANLQIDHEFMRNVILRGHGSVQYAQYLQGGTQTNFNVGGGVNWLLNRNVRLSLDYDYTHQTAATGLNTSINLNKTSTTQFTQSLVGLTLHLGL